MRNNLELKARAVRFFSREDEAAFFGWLDKLPCVSDYTGKGDTLYISINDQSFDDEALRELLALFYRYKIDMSQLRVFDREEFADWFQNPKAYWFDLVFS